MATVSAFIYFGARIDAGFPFNKHRAEDTGGWVGPLNIIMASGEFDNTKTNNGDNNTVIVDRYISRYVESPLTQYLKMPANCTLLGEDDFNKVAGPIAVDSTTKGQYDPNRNQNDKNYDPYEDHLGTCDNGDLKPLLPLIQFDFERNLSTNEENIQVKLNCKYNNEIHHGYHFSPGHFFIRIQGVAHYYFISLLCLLMPCTFFFIILCT